MRNFIFKHIGWTIGIIDVLIALAAMSIVYFSFKAALAFPF